MKYIFEILLCLVIVSGVSASDAVLWRQELSCDSNSTCKPGALMVDKNSNEVIILGTSKQTDTKETTCWLWKINPNGVVTHKKSLGVESKHSSFMARIFGIKSIVQPDTGDVVRLKLDNNNSVSLSVTDRNILTRTAELDSGQDWAEGILLHGIAPCKNGDLLIVGQDNGAGIVMRTDISGNVKWKKTFDTEQTENLTSVAYSADGNDFYVVGLSASMVGKMEFEDAAEVCVLRYDGDGKLKVGDFFKGGVAPWPTSSPKIVCLASGKVVVVYDKSNNVKATELYAKIYTRELTPLGEKQMLKTKEDGPPAFFDVCATSENRFVLIGVVDYKDLRIYECKEDGTILQTLELDGKVGGGATRVYVEYLTGKIFVAFASRSQENAEGTKIELLALKPYKAD